MTHTRSSFLLKWGLLSMAVIAVTGLFFGAIAPVKATSLPTDFVETLYVNGFANPTAMRFAPDGRLFITQQTGQLRVVENDVLVPTPALALTVDSGGERGLLGLAFDPNFGVDNYIYLYYTVPGIPDPVTPPHNRVSRFAITGNVVNPASEEILLELNNLGTNIHNGGSINFGADGMLYIATGDNGIGSNSQNMNNMFGKILRIEKDGSIPKDNPFYDTATGDNRTIWALGVRNPYTSAFQPGTGLYYINDVGSNGLNAIEEINQGSSGANFGWNVVEGEVGNPLYEDPIYSYTHDNGECAITGGVFYNPTTATFPAEYVGDYFFGDFCASWIYSYDIASDTATPFATSTAVNVTDLAVSADGDLYYLARGGGGQVFKISYVEGSSTETPTSTSTIDPEVTPTETTVPPLDLVVNGGFEVGDVNNTSLPANWKAKNIAKDKIKCNKADKVIAHSGECAFLFKGVPGEKGGLVQKPAVDGLLAGDTLTLHAFVKARKLSLNISNLKLVVKFPTADKVKFTLPLDQNYDDYTELFDTASLTEAPTKVKLTINSRSATGKWWVDDVSLLVNEVLTDTLIPLPLPLP